MSEYEALREDMALIADSFAEYSRVVNDHAAHANRQIKRLWDDNAELRDELHAVANRLQNLTRAITTEPAEVAESMVSQSRWHECDCGVLVRRSASDRLFYDDSGLHTCNVESVMTPEWAERKWNERRGR